MQKPKLTHKDYTLNGGLYQLKLPLNIETVIWKSKFHTVAEIYNLNLGVEVTFAIHFAIALYFCQGLLKADLAWSCINL